jgi:hypothetical protein
MRIEAAPFQFQFGELARWTAGDGCPYVSFSAD